MKMSENVKQFSLPGGVYLNTRLIHAIVDAYRKYPMWWKSDIKIDSVFDSFSGIWCGGRIFNYPEQTLDDIEHIVEFYNSRGIGFRQIFSNFYAYTFIDDQRCHDIMKILNYSHLNECVVACDFTLKVLREKYPNVKYISSCTKALLDANLLFKELNKDEYDMVCLWISMHKPEIFKSIPENLRSKVEVMPWQLCNPDCKYFYRCAYYINYEVLKYFHKDNVIPRPTLAYTCTAPTNIHSAEQIFKLPYVMHNEDLDKLAEQGYTNFKINGRVSPVSQTELMKIILYYVADPQYYDEVIAYISNYEDETLKGVLS